MTKTENLVNNLTELCVKRGLHYSELLPVVEQYYKTRCEKPTGLYTPQGVVGLVRNQLNQKYPLGWL